MPGQVWEKQNSVQWMKYWVGCWLDKTKLRGETHINIYIQCCVFVLSEPSQVEPDVSWVSDFSTQCYLLQWLLEKLNFSHGLLFSCFPWPWDEGLGVEEKQHSWKISEWLAKPAVSAEICSTCRTRPPEIWAEGAETLRDLVLLACFIFFIFYSMTTYAHLFCSYFFYFLYEFY